MTINGASTTIAGEAKPGPTYLYDMSMFGLFPELTFPEGWSSIRSFVFGVVSLLQILWTWMLLRWLVLMDIHTFAGNIRNKK